MGNRASTAKRNTVKPIVNFAVQAAVLGAATLGTAVIVNEVACIEKQNR